jgi:endonuclease/exonuclease/phosphatase family metal-dependent hydrolase
MRCLVLVLALAGCRGGETSEPGIDGDGFPYPPPRTDAFQHVGSPDTLEIAAWNIENFPARNTTPARVADLIASLDLDVIVCEEIASETAWAELLARLRDYTGQLSTHTYTSTEYQKLGIIYRTSLVKAEPLALLATESSYEFPRPPISVLVTIDDGVHPARAIRVIGVHLKAGIGAEDSTRRGLAIQQLDTMVRARVMESEAVVVAGDYNEVITTPEGAMNFAPFLSAPDIYTVQTKAAAESGQITFVPSAVMLDHITTAAVDLPGAQVVIPRLHTLPAYVSEVSDHLPVVLVSPL